MIYAKWPEGTCNEPITPDHRGALDEIVAEVLGIHPNEDSVGDEFRAAVVIVAGGFLVGPFVDRIVAVTGYPCEEVTALCDRMRAAGLWQDDMTIVEWIEDDGSYSSTSLCCQVLVAQGLMTAREDENHGWEYRSAPVN